MIGFIGISFLALAFLMALVASHQLMIRRPQVVDRRIYEVGTPVGTVLNIAGERRLQTKLLSRFLAFAATLAPSSLRGRDLRDQLAGGGVYAADGIRLYVGAKVLLAGLLGSASYMVMMLMHRPQAEQTIAGLMIGLIGFNLPVIWLRLRTQRRRYAIRLALPDALDLLVVCVEAGLGVNAALMRVGGELRWSCPPLSQELRLLNQEIRAGNSRPIALRNLAQRVPIPDIQSLVAMFVQADRLGTSVGRPLRVHSDMLRTKRRQRAEESARKATVKLIFPLVFFIFPELLVVILGPAGLQLFNTLLEMAGHP